MDCDRFREQRVLAAWGEEPSDGEWPAHLASCPACARDIDEIREVRRLYAELPGPAMSGDLTRRIVGAGRPVPRRSLVALAAMLLIGIVVPIVVVRTSGTRTAPPPPPAAAWVVVPSGTEVAERLEAVRRRVEQLDVRPLPEPEHLDDEFETLRRRVASLLVDSERF